MTKVWWMAVALAGCLASASAEEPGALQARISGKTGVQAARRWTVEVENRGKTAVRAVEIRAVRLTPGGGETCKPKIRKPAKFPLRLGAVAAGRTAKAQMAIDFTGCSNRAQFAVEIEYGARGGRAETLARKSEFR
jgi:hypothetical protein